MTRTIELTDEQWQALQRGESITIEPPKKQWEPEGGSMIVQSTGAVHQELMGIAQQNFGTAYQTVALAKRAAKLMRPHHRFVAYALEHWPDYEAPEPTEFAYCPQYNARNDRWYVCIYSIERLPWIPYGPEDKVQELVDKLNSGEVVL